MAEKASTLIRDAYLKHPTMLYGHAPTALISAAVYISGVILEKRRTQFRIWQAGGATCTAPVTQQQYEAYCKELALTPHQPN